MKHGHVRVTSCVVPTVRRNCNTGEEEVIVARLSRCKRGKVPSFFGHPLPGIVSSIIPIAPRCPYPGVHRR